MSIRTLLVDDHQMFREGLRAILERDTKLTVVGEASDGRAAVEMALGALSPEVVIMDIGMAGLNGIEATRKIVTDKSDVKVIALSAHSDRRFIAAILEAGASGYVMKEAAGEEILRAVHAVQAGKKFLSTEIAGPVIEGFINRRTSSDGGRILAHLGAREREIVQLLAEGKTSKELANLLHISVKTVETHRRNIMGKLKVKSIASLTKYAIREGLTSAED